MGTASVLVLLVIAAISGSTLVAIIAAVLGILGIVIICAAVTRIAEKFVASTDVLSTRARNIESRVAAMAYRIETAEGRASAGESESAALASAADELGRRAAALERDAVSTAERTALLEARAGSHNHRLSQTIRRIGDVSASLRSAENSVELARGDLAKLRTAHAKSEEQARRIRKDIQVLRTRVPAGFLEPVEDQLKEIRSTSREMVRASFESAVQLGRDPRAVLSSRLAHVLFGDYLRREEYLQLRPLIESFDVLEKQNLTTLRAIYRYFRATGYWDLAEKAVTQIHAKSGGANDGIAVQKIRAEIELFSHPDAVRPELPDRAAYDPSGPIVHMVGRVLPETQTGYTLRTHYTAQAQARKGLPVVIVGQSGIAEREVASVEHYQHQGISYYLLPGPARSQELVDAWLRRNIIELAELVGRIRPSILHAQSDFFNALIVDVVGKKYGIPTVYESRGFWEESWLSRTITAKGWGHRSDSLFAMYGLPEAYRLRKQAEEIARLQPDHVFTLAEVMRDHILTSAEGKILETQVSIVPNAVESANFPVQEPDRVLAAEIGLPPGAVVVGYISSIVEYEGIDTLLDAYNLASSASARPLCLLLVGDGNYLATLQKHVRDANIRNVYFTGRVPHEKVLDYYGLIDVFVVPRKASAVADLVTPLKPFEAFSTGRAVVLSDVGALQEIARQSGAVETFRAGDARDLSKTLVALIEDPGRRAALSESAARWVRNHRTWDRNVNEYYRVYEKLGFFGRETALIKSELALNDLGANRGELLEALREAELSPLEGWFTTQPEKQTGASIIEEGWRFAQFQPVKVTEIEDWNRFGAEDRSWGFHLHAWEFIDPLLFAYEETGEVDWLSRGVAVALAWIDAHRHPPAESDPMAWYEMSLALRVPRLIGLLLRAARLEELEDAAVILADALVRHIDELRADRAFNPSNNHGFYTAISQVHAAKYAGMLPGAGVSGVEGRSRLAQTAMAQFAGDGVHREHSPEYHQMLLNSFDLAVDDGLIEDGEVKERLRRAAHVLGWMIQPDGTLVQLGDTPESSIVKEGAQSRDRHTQFLLSDGREGEPNTEELATYHEGGYAFVRSPQPKSVGELASSGYLAFSAGFHSRAHKHADDLTVVWHDRGQQILVDGGRFGYGDLLPADAPERRDGFYYAAPERQYVEGTMAHNTLMLDGSDQKRRGREPYGSALGECTESGGVFGLSARVRHLDYTHRRRIVYRPGEELLLKDSVFSESTEVREATLWLNVAGHFELEAVEEDLVFVAGQGVAATRLRISGPGRVIEPVRGHESPLRGWRSRADRTLEPVWSVGFSFDLETRASVTTSLRLSS